MSNFAMNAVVPKDRTKTTASSKEENLTEKSSLEIPSLTDEPLGDERSRMIRKVPSFFGTAPIEENNATRVYLFRYFAVL